jgi:hypothetical protein
MMTATKSRSIELSRRVKDDSADIPSWLELVSLQDVLFRENEEHGHVRTKEENKGLAALKLSMLEKALPHAGSAGDREKLLIRLMHEGSKVWKPQSSSERWIEVTTQNPDSFALWRARMDFEMTNLDTFSFDRIKKIFIDRLEFLAPSLGRESDQTAGMMTIAEQAIYVFLRLTNFLYESGHVDHAVAAWQAMLELHFARPRLNQDDRASAMPSLAEFWDSEVARIGETGAMGWRRFVESTEADLDVPTPRLSSTELVRDTRDVYKAWATTEQKRALEARMPARVADETDDADPYRVVLLSDIEPGIIYLPASISHSLRSQLVDAFLLFCRMPPAFVSGKVIESALDDPFIYGRSETFKLEISHTPGDTTISTETHRQSPKFKADGSRMLSSPEILCSTGHSWFAYLESWRELYPKQDEPVELSFLMSTLRQLTRTFEVEELASYCLAVEWLNSPDTARKAAKAMLKQYSSNLSLYNTFALLEWSSGNREVAQRVLSSATSQTMVSPTATYLRLRIGVDMYLSQQARPTSSCLIPGPG